MQIVHRSMQLKNAPIVLNYKENEFQMSMLYTYKCHCYVTENVTVFSHKKNIEIVTNRATIKSMQINA